MPGNEVEDRVHNFFAQEDLSSSHHQSQAADGSWHGQGSNLWPGSPMHIGLSSSSSKGYNLQPSDTERGQNSHSFQVAHGMNHAQTTLGVELAKSHSQSQLPNSNGFMPGRQFLQTRQSEANFLGFDTEPDRHTMTSRGISNFESQGRISIENNIGSVRSESSESRIGFDFLGSHQQMSRQQMGMQQSLPQQLSGFNDMQPLQQQAMLRKMQELQRQQLEALHNNSPNQNPPIINGTPISANNSWPPDPSAGNKSWLHRAAQGPSNELRFPPEQGQTLSLMGLTPQQTDQSLFGVPVSNMRGTSNHFSNVAVDKHPMHQMAMYSNSSPGDQYSGPTNQVNVQDGSLSSRQRIQEENFFGQPSGQTLVRGMYSGNPHLVHSLQRDSPVQELNSPSEIMEEKPVLPVSSLQDAVALDPTEEKILFGNGNIWDSFGDSVDVGAGGGSWSALMQSAVGETSSNDIGLQEEWSGPNVQNTEVSLGPLSDDININKSFQGVPGFQKPVHTYPSEHGDRQQMDSMHKSFQHFSEEGKHTHGEPGSVAMILLCIGKFSNEFNEKILKVEEDFPGKECFKEIGCNTDSGYPENPSAVASVFHKFLKDLHDSFNIDGWAYDYISPVYLFYLLEQLLLWSSFTRKFCFTTKSSLVEWIIGGNSSFSGIFNSGHDAHILTKDICDFLATIIEKFMFDRRIVTEWIRKCGLNFNQYYPLLLLRMIVTLCLVCGNCGSYFHILSRVLEKNNITSWLPIDFIDVLRRRKGKNWLIMNAIETPNILAEALMKIGDPLVIVSMAGNKCKFTSPYFIFVDINATSCKESVLGILFSIKSEVLQGHEVEAEAEATNLCNNDNDWQVNKALSSKNASIPGQKINENDNGRIMFTSEEETTSDFFMTRKQVSQLKG